MKLKIKIAPAFKALFDYKNLSNYREFIFYGGRASGKTYHIRLALTLMCLREKSHFIIFREVEQQIQYARDDFKAFLDEVGIPYTLQPLKESIEYKDFVASVTNFQITFYNGSTILLSFINDKVSKKRKSLRFDLRGAWIDEANFVTSTIRNDLLPSIRGKDSFVIYSFNPENKEDIIYQTAINPNLITIYSKKVNYYDNPFFPGAMEIDRLNDLEILPKEVYLHKWEGEPLEFNDNEVIDISKIGYYDDMTANKYEHIILTMDTAFSTKESADYSVIGVYAKINNEVRVLRIYRGHWDFNMLVNMAKEAFMWAQEKGNVYALLIEKKASGISLLQELKRTTNLPISELMPKTDKFARVCNVLSEFHNLKMPLDRENHLNDWVDTALKELKMFRSDLKHLHDDIVDSIVYALEYFKESKIDWNYLAKIIP